MIMVDSDILIWILRGNTEIKQTFEKYVQETNGFIYITPIQIAEIYAGLHESEKTVTKLFLESLSIIDFNEDIGLLSGEYMRLFKKTHNVTLADSLIAASTINSGLKLWTLNKKHYPMIKDDLLL